MRATLPNLWSGVTVGPKKIEAPPGAKMVTIYIDGQEITVPQGTLVIDAAKMLGLDIPHFCYHPRLKPVGMCRQCLVEVGFPRIDRQTRQPVLDENGKPIIDWRPALDTSCTMEIGNPMVCPPGAHIRVNSELAIKNREHVNEFLLINHPLD